MARKAEAIVVPAETPNLICPFSGQPIEIRRTEDNLYWLAGCKSDEGSWSTGLFGSHEDLVWFLSTRLGIRPAFPKRPVITLTERVPPPSDPTADLKEKGRVLDEASQEYAARAVRDSGVGRS